MNGNGVEPLLMGNSKHITIVKFKIYALLTFSIKVSSECLQSVQPTGKNPAVVKKDFVQILFIFVFSSSWSRGMGFSTAKSATSGGRVLMYGASLERVRLVVTSIAQTNACWAKIERLLWQVYYKQLCRKCQVGFNPYRVESILCKVRELVFEELSQDDLFTWT